MVRGASPGCEPADWGSDQAVGLRGLGVVILVQQSEDVGGVDGVLSVGHDGPLNHGPPGGVSGDPWMRTGEAGQTSHLACLIETKGLCPWSSVGSCPDRYPACTGRRAALAFPVSAFPVRDVCESQVSPDPGRWPYSVH